MLKPEQMKLVDQDAGQPPSGGCVLKHHIPPKIGGTLIPAAFRRLCVETNYGIIKKN